MYKHYIRPDANGIVIHGYTDGFLKESNGDEEILPGDLELQGYETRQFTINLYTERMQYKYKVAGGQMVERTQTELDAEYAARPAPTPSSDDRITAMEDWIMGQMFPA